MWDNIKKKKNSYNNIYIFSRGYEDCTWKLSRLHIRLFSKNANFSPVGSFHRLRCWKPGSQGLRVCPATTTNHKVGWVFIYPQPVRATRIIHFYCRGSTRSQPEIIWKRFFFFFCFLSPSRFSQDFIFAIEHGEVENILAQCDVKNLCTTSDDIDLEPRGCPTGRVYATFGVYNVRPATCPKLSYNVNILEIQYMFQKLPNEIILKIM